MLTLVGEIRCYRNDCYYFYYLLYYLVKPEGRDGLKMPCPVQWPWEQVVVIIPRPKHVVWLVCHTALRLEPCTVTSHKFSSHSRPVQAPNIKIMTQIFCSQHWQHAWIHGTLNIHRMWYAFVKISYLLNTYYFWMSITTFIFEKWIWL